MPLFWARVTPDLAAAVLATRVHARRGLVAADCAIPALVDLEEVSFEFAARGLVAAALAIPASELFVIAAFGSTILFAVFHIRLLILTLMVLADQCFDHLHFAFDQGYRTESPTLSFHPVMRLWLHCCRCCCRAEQALYSAG